MLPRHAARVVLALAVPWAAGCGSHAPRPLQAELTARCPQAIRVGDRPTLAVDVANSEKRAWPAVFLAARGEGRLALASVSEAGRPLAVARAPGGVIRASRSLQPRQKRRFRFSFVARREGGEDMYVYAWGARSARRVPSGASSIDCPVGVYARHPPATARERRAETRRLTGRGDPRPQFIVGRRIGTLIVEHDSRIRWTAAGKGTGVFFSLSGDGLSLGSQASRGTTRTSGSRLVPAGTYRNVQVRAVGSWTAVITPL